MPPIAYVARQISAEATVGLLCFGGWISSLSTTSALYPASLTVLRTSSTRAPSNRTTEAVLVSRLTSAVRTQGFSCIAPTILLTHKLHDMPLIASVIRVRELVQWSVLMDVRSTSRELADTVLSELSFMGRASTSVEPKAPESGPSWRKVHSSHF